MSQAASEFLKVFQTPPPTYSQEYALQILERQFGCQGQLRALGSERDQNFLVTTDNGDKRLLKFSNYAEDPGITNFQTAAFLHVEKTDPEMIVSRVLPALDRTYEVRIHGGDGNDSTVRLFTWIEGVAMIDVPENKRPGNPGVMGGRLARMGSALEGFEHASMGYELAYDVRLVEKLEPLLKYVDDSDLSSFVSQQLEMFRNNVKPALGSMPAQVIFNDMSPRNYIVDPEHPVSFRGFIDFGDMIHAPLIMDIAVACVYWINESSDPLSDVALFLKGYHQHRNLEKRQLAILQDVMLCRAVIQVLVYHWRANMFPENSAYIMQNLPQVRRTINILKSLDRSTVLQKVMAGCGL